MQGIEHPRQECSVRQFVTAPGILQAPGDGGAVAARHAVSTGQPVQQAIKKFGIRHPGVFLLREI
jgi:hypothetical protein